MQILKITKIAPKIPAEVSPECWSLLSTMFALEGKHTTLCLAHTALSSPSQQGLPFPCQTLWILVLWMNSFSAFTQWQLHATFASDWRQALCCKSGRTFLMPHHRCSSTIQLRIHTSFVLNYLDKIYGKKKYICSLFQHSCNLAYVKRWYRKFKVLVNSEVPIKLILLLINALAYKLLETFCPLLH